MVWLLKKKKIQLENDQTSRKNTIRNENRAAFSFRDPPVFQTRRFIIAFNLERKNKQWVQKWHLCGSPKKNNHNNQWRSNKNITILFNFVFFYAQVTQDEWCAMWNDFSKNPDTPQEWQTHYMNFMFDLVDTSGDSSIQIIKYTFNLLLDKLFNVHSNKIALINC